LHESPKKPARRFNTLGVFFLGDRRGTDRILDAINRELELVFSKEKALGF